MLRCLEVPHGVSRETDFITDRTFSLLCPPDIGAVAFFERRSVVPNTGHRTDNKSFLHAMQ